MSTRRFRSVQANTLKAYLEMKIAMGYKYITQGVRLYQFDRHLFEQAYPYAWLEREIVESFLHQFKDCNAYSQSCVRSTMRGYCRCLHLREPCSYVLERSLAKAKRPSRFYIYSHNEVTVLSQAAAALGPPGSIRGDSVKALLCLLYTCGLRISEALALNVEDMDREQRTLLVRNGKFGKDRYVPLSVSSIEALLRYRQKAAPISKDQALFISSRGTRLSRKTVGNIFRRLLRECGIASQAPWPRLHDLRHTYAVNCLCKWYEQGLDVNAMLPVLSTVMGHVKVSCTQVYLHVPAQLREHAAERFAQHIETRIIPER